MQPDVIGTIGVVVTLILILLGVPVGVVLAFVGFGGVILVSGFKAAFGLLSFTPYHVTAVYALAVVPFFMLMGEFAMHGGLSQMAFDSAYKWLGRLPAGLGLATVAANTAFAAMSGSSVSAAAVFSKIAVPEMLRYKYNPSFATGITAGAGNLASLIPPSASLVIYGILTEQSIGKLLIAGIIPGIINAILYGAYILIRVKFNPSLAPTASVAASWNDRILSLGGLAPVLIVFFLMFGGIYAGAFTPTEAGAIGTFALFLVAIFRRKLNPEVMLGTFKGVAHTTFLVCIILIGAMIFGRFLAMSGVSQAFVTFTAGLPVPPIMIILGFLFIFLLAGTLLEAIAMLSLIVPLVFPATRALGFDSILFGILVVKMIEIGMLTPPVGLNCYVIKGSLGNSISLEEVFRGALPFVLVDFVMIALLLTFPQIALWLPNKIM